MTDTFIRERRGKLGHRHRETQGEGNVKVEADIGVMQLQAEEGMPRLASNQQELEEPSEGAWPC